MVHSTERQETTAVYRICKFLLTLYQRIQHHSCTPYRIKKLKTWSLATEEAFNKLNQVFITVPIVHHPNPECPFIVDVAASETGVGVIFFPTTWGAPKIDSYHLSYHWHKEIMILGFRSYLQ